jgi:hypothetical protein
VTWMEGGERGGGAAAARSWIKLVRCMHVCVAVYLCLCVYLPVCLSACVSACMYTDRKVQDDCRQDRLHHHSSFHPQVVQVGLVPVNVEGLLKKHATGEEGKHSDCASKVGAVGLVLDTAAHKEQE